MISAGNTKHLFISNRVVLFSIKKSFGFVKGENKKCGISDLSFYLMLLFSFVCAIIVKSVKEEFLSVEKKKRTCSRASSLEQATGIEPAYSAWEADVLPLNYACKKTPASGVFGANGGTRTPDLLITNQLLYQLSHISG